VLARALTLSGRLLDAAGVVDRFYDARARLAYLRDRDLRERNRFLLERADADGFPLPPPALVYEISQTFDLETYIRSGVEHASVLRGVLASQGIAVGSLRSILDFGCGCGRVLRRWHDEANVDLHGSDYNPRLIDWCRRSLPFADFRVNGLAPPLAYDDESFDFIYALSVFTHLTEELQDQWLVELQRVLAPKGFLAFTVKGREWLAGATEAERRRFDAGEPVFQAQRYAGKNLCAAFHPERYVRDHLAVGFELRDFVPATESLNQDLVLLQKPA
jgi:SAM-dependent methyltransferase